MPYLIVYSLNGMKNRHRLNTDENTGTCPPEKFHAPKGANTSAQYIAVGTFATFLWQGDHVGERVDEGVNVELVK